MAYKVLPPGLAQLLIQGIEDELTPLAEQRALSIKNRHCPRCKGSMQPHLHATHAFTDGELLPRTVARCVDCELIYDPTTDLILDTGDARKIEEALPLIRGED